jgi:hypothetical protein
VSASPIPSSAGSNHPSDQDGTDGDNQGEGGNEGGNASDQERAGAALRAAFARLAPQGSDEWNFMGAFTQLGDRYGPYQPGASVLADLVEGPGTRGARRTGRGRRRSVGPATYGEKSEVDEAMGPVVEALRFLAERVSTLEARIAAQDSPVDGAAWLTPARELGDWAGPVAAHVAARSPGGTVVHADCGEGAALSAFSSRGLDALGIEPRGGVALRALESGHAVAIAEAHEHLVGLPSALLGGMVLSGVVDRLPVYAVLPLLAEARRTLADGAPIVVVSETADATGSREAPAADLVSGHPLHEATWGLLLDRAGFVEIAPLRADEVRDGRFAMTALVPTW